MYHWIHLGWKDVREIGFAYILVTSVPGGRPLLVGARAPDWVVSTLVKDEYGVQSDGTAHTWERKDYDYHSHANRA